MKPEILSLKGFLSYRQKQTLDFSKFHIALISGENGHGKSSLLDGITFALYSMARGVEGNKKGIGDLVSNSENNLYVQLQFEQNDDIYRITRTYDKVKSISNAILEIKRNESFVNISENTLRETDERIKEILRMDYDTFLTSSFIMQGKSDYFTAKSPTEKIEILREMLMLGLYEKAREIAKEETREITIQNKNLAERIEEIKERLKEKEELVLNLQETMNKLAIESEALTLLKRKLDETVEKASEKKSILEKVNNSSSNIERFSSELIKVKSLLELKEKEKSELLSIIESQEEINNGFERLVEIKNKLSEMIEKSLKVETLKRKKDNLQSNLDKEIASREQKIFQNKQRIKELENDIVKGKNLTLTLEQELSKLEIDNAAIIQNEKNLDKELSETKSKIEELNSLMKVKATLEGKIKEIQSIKRERINSIEKKTLEIKREFKKIEEEISNANIKELEKSFEEIDKTLVKVENNLDKKKELINQKTLINKDIETLMEKVSEIDDKIGLLSQEGVGHCPLCGTKLTEGHKEKLLFGFNSDKGVKESLIKNFKETLSTIKEELKNYNSLDEKMHANIKKERDNANIKLEKTKENVLKGENRKKELADILEGLAKTTQSNVLNNDEQKQLNELSSQVQSYSSIEKTIEELKNKEALIEQELANGRNLSNKLIGKLSSIKADITNCKKDSFTNGEKIELLLKEYQESEKELSDPKFMRDIKNIIASVIKEIGEINFDEDKLNAAKRLKEKLSAFEEKHEKLKEARLRITEIDKSINDKKKQYENLSNELQNEKTKLKNARNSLKGLEDIEKRNEELKKEVAEKEKTITLINESKVRFEEKIRELEKLEKESIQHEKTLSENNEKRQMLEVCTDMFGKEGIPIAVIRSILPEIEAFANDLLIRMTNGSMQVKFQTIKDSKSGEKSTLQIDVYDNGERRRYELFSGGEQFRINLAIRIGISLFLSSAVNTPLETLVIDEGFGSQDESGKERILYEINTIKDQFKKVLIISHVGDIKESFPYEIRVVKDTNGSHINIV